MIYLKKVMLVTTILCTIIVYGSEPVIKNGDRLAIVGDSITEQVIYSQYIETYLLACAGQKDTQIFEFGWGGERAVGLIERLENDILRWKPTIVTLCYGMNDGGYRKFDESIGALYRTNMGKIVKKLKSNGCTVILGTPGAVDVDTYKRSNAEEYNKNLGTIAEIAKNIATQNSLVIADIHAAMMNTQIEAKRALGKSYHVCGFDGVHPSQNGHIVMAFAFLKAMGFGDKIADIDMDFNGSSAKVSEGHKIVSQDKGMLELESSKYPFCFSGKNEKLPSDPTSILPFIPFQQELNRFDLRIRNLPSEHAEICWGNWKKTFSRQDLEIGINLSAEFLNNPFSDNFEQFRIAVCKRQNFEIWMVKNFITQFRMMEYRIPGSNKDEKFNAALKLISDKMYQQRELLDVKAKSIIVPVKHRIKVIPLNS